MRRCGGYNSRAGEDSVLDCEGAGGRATAVDEEEAVVFFEAVAGEGEAEGLVESLTDGDDSCSEGGGVFGGHCFGDLNIISLVLTPSIA